MIEVEENGVVHEFPDGTSQDVIRGALQRKYAPVQKSPLESGMLGRANAALQGAGQAVTFGLLDEMVDVPTAAIKSMGDSTFKEEYAKQRAVGQDILGGLSTNYPVETIGGNIAGGLLGAGATGATQAGRAVSGMLGSGNTGARIAKGALSGGILGAAYGAGSAEDGKRLQGAGMGGLLGASIGGAVPGVSGVVKSLTPTIDDSTKTLAQSAKSKYGIDLNVNQISGSNVSQNLQRASQAIPLSGTEKNRLKQLSQWNKAVSGTFGQQIDDFTMDNIDEAFKKAGKPFDDILSGKTITVNQNDLDEIADIVKEATKNVEPSKVAIIQSNIDELLSGVKGGQITGEKLNSIRSSLTDRAKSADPFARPFISKLVNKVVDISADGDPAIAQKLNEARKNYKNLNVALNAWDSTTNSINPARLETAVKATSGYGKRSYARGKAGDLGELAQIGKTFLPQVGGSPTLPAALTNASVLGIGSGFFEPTAAALTAGGMLLNRGLQEGINRNPAVVNSMLRQGTNLPAITSQSLRTPVGAGMLGGYLGSQ